MKEQCSKSKNRIVVSSLYFGSGNLEKELVDAIENNMNTNPNVKFKMILDYSRYLRIADKSREYLEPLLSNFEDRFNLFLYHTPNLRGLAKKFIPERTNESLGVLHMKIYITDDTLIISGANLSNDYFTNRQDRYIILKNCHKLCNYLESLIDSLSEFSFKVSKSGEPVYANQDPMTHPFLGDKNQLRESLSKKLQHFLDEQRNNQLKVADEHKNDAEKAYVYPLIQMSDANVHVDELVTRKILNSAPATSNISLAVGYFNLTENYIQSIVKFGKASFQILVSSPEANGFFNSTGFSNNVPKIYSHLEEEFFKYYSQNDQASRINIYEYKRDNWTFHAKGLWYYPKHNNLNKLPNMTIIGSSNFGYRSVYRDPELQLVIHSKCEKLQKTFDMEKKNLFENYTTLVTQDIFSGQTRAIPFWLKLFCRSFKSYF